MAKKKEPKYIEVRRKGEISSSFKNKTNTNLSYTVANVCNKENGFYIICANNDLTIP